MSLIGSLWSSSVNKASQKVANSVIPAAGFGTRFLPATKAVPKELLPIIDKPAIQHVVEEAVASGLDRILIVTSRNKHAIEDHFDRALEVEQRLIRTGDTTGLAQVRHCIEFSDIHYVRQSEARGVGDAVLHAQTYVGDQPFVVLLPDELIEPSARLLERMLNLHAQVGGSIVALMKVPSSQIHLYGCASVEPTPDEDVVRITGLVEKPSAEEAPSDLAVIGRFVLAPIVFAELRRTGPGRQGEIQLTDALHEMAQPGHEGGPVHGILFSGRRHDTGDRGGYLRAVVQMACERDDVGPEFREWLRIFAKSEL
jgi:UTP--glucose-1-phosphate uridylyltransferase